MILYGTFGTVPALSALYQHFSALYRGTLLETLVVFLRAEIGGNFAGQNPTEIF
jgi:hypothetical protein